MTPQGLIERPNTRLAHKAVLDKIRRRFPWLAWSSALSPSFQTANLHRTMVKVCRSECEGTVTGTRDNGESCADSGRSNAGG
jgi:hypothetical protein